MSLATSNRDGGKTSEAGHLRAIAKGVMGEVLTGLVVSQRAAGANMSVDIAIGDAVIPRSDATYGHPAWNDAVLNQTITTADGSNPRRDIVIMYINYGVTPSTAVSNNTNGVVAVAVVAGTPAGSPTDPSDAALQSAAGSGNPYIKLARVRVGTGVTTISNSVIDDMRTMAQAVENGGWNPLAVTWDAWNYSAWDSTNKLATINVPDSSIFTLGQKARYWQSTGGWKYGFIVKLTDATTIVVYQGTDYTLNNERMYLPSYSRDKIPSGFPINPDKWTQVYTDSTQRTQTSPTANTWYNPGSPQLSIPIGCWKASYDLCAYQNNGVAENETRTTLSTANNTESDFDFTARIGGSGLTIFNATIHREKILNLTTTTTYFLNTKAVQASATNIINANSSSPLFIRAVCAYL